MGGRVGSPAWRSAKDQGQGMEPVGARTQKTRLFSSTLVAAQVSTRYVACFLVEFPELVALVVALRQASV